MTAKRRLDSLISREQVAAVSRHWVGLGTACNNRCLFCLDGDKRTMLLPEDAILHDLRRGRSQGAERVILSGGEASVHPAFVRIIRHARTLGYAWVQTITNGVRFADPTFLEACINAGLDEITFSVHGHTAQLHDHLTGHPGAFCAVVTAIARALRTHRLVVSVDVLLCRENIDVLDRIVEMCIGLGVREFDLLQVIPHGRAYNNRDAMLYEPAEHLPVLQRVLRLARHPELTVWTNRLPARYLEGFEELIQDPHKLHDEVHGRELMLRAWLNDGVELPCRQSERCRSCCLDQFCAFVEDRVRRIEESRWEVLDIGAADPAHLPWRQGLPFGCSRMEIDADCPADWWHFRQAGVTGLILHSKAAIEPSTFGEPSLPLMLVVQSTEQLDACFRGDRLPRGVMLEVDLNENTAAWMLSNRRALEQSLDSVRIHQSGPERLGHELAHPVDSRGVLGALDLPVAVSGLPRCLMAAAVPAEQPATLDLGLLDPSSGRIDLQALVASFIRDGYLVKSLRCTGCVWNAACSGLQINLARVFGLGALSPLDVPVEVS